MKYYVLELDKIPSILFAHSYHTGLRHWQLLKMPGVLEIAYVEEGEIIIKDGDDEVSVPTGSTVCINHCRPMTVYNVGKEHRHITVSFTAGETHLTDAPERSSRAVLPSTIASDDNGVIALDIRRIIMSRTENRIRRSALLLTLLGDMTALSERSIHTDNPICRRAKEIIDETYCGDGDLFEAGRLSMSELAERLSVSYGYLSRIFKAEENLTLTDYINRKRLERVREILCISDMTLQKAGKCAGFEDVKYLSRLFRYTYGITAREYITSIRSHPEYYMYLDAPEK